MQHGLGLCMLHYLVIGRPETAFLALSDFGFVGMQGSKRPPDHIPQADRDCREVDILRHRAT